MLEEKNEELVQELQKAKGEVKQKTEAHEAQMSKWRQERDKLVGQLEAILKQKDATIEQLKSQHGPAQVVYNRVLYGHKIG